jgi:hypothetical protein
MTRLDGWRSNTLVGWEGLRLTKSPGVRTGQRTAGSRGLFSLGNSHRQMTRRIIKS